jgi:hypothetical protein
MGGACIAHMWDGSTSHIVIRNAKGRGKVRELGVDRII